jgi:hypothetical protein
MNCLGGSIARLGGITEQDASATAPKVEGSAESGWPSTNNDHIKHSSNFLSTSFLRKSVQMFFQF